MSKDNWHYSEQGSICRPIKSLEELLFWDEDQILSEESTTDIIPVTPASDGLVRKVKRGVRNKLIICHDMKVRNKLMLFVIFTGWIQRGHLSERRGWADNSRFYLEGHKHVYLLLSQFHHCSKYVHN